MQKNITVSLFEVVGSPLCVASGDGHKVYDRIASVLEQGHGVVLSFYNINALTSAFLNAAIGQLYGKFSEEKIRSSLELRDIEADELALIKRVVDTAKQYFKDPERFNQAIREERE